MFEYLFQAFESNFKLILNSLTTFHLTLSLILILFSIFIVYKIYSKLYVFSDQFRAVNESRLNKFNSFNRKSERPQEYPNGWIPILESRDLKVNQTKPVNALGYEFVVFRGPSGSAHVIDAFCPHLGAHFGVGSTVGRSKCGEDCIQCPFHGWTFRSTDGLCVEIPDLQNKEVESLNAKIKIWKSIEVNDVIYVWHHLEDKEPDWEPDVVPQIHNKKWVCLARVQHSIECHIQEIVENWIDLGHFSTIHQKVHYPINSLNKMKMNMDNLIITLVRLSEITFGEPFYKAMATMKCSPLFFGFISFDYKFEVEQIGPATIMVSYNKDTEAAVSGSLVVHVCPVQTNKVTFIMKIYSAPGFWARVFANFVWYAERIMIERDLFIWNNKRFVKNGKFTKTDKTTVQFRRWYSQFYSDNCYQSLEW